MADATKKALKRLQQAARAPSGRRPYERSMFFTASHPSGTGSVVVDLNGAGAYAYDEACGHLAEDLQVGIKPAKEATDSGDLRALLFWQRHMVTRLYEARRLVTSARNITEVGEFVGDLLQTPPGGANLMEAYTRPSPDTPSMVEALYAELRHLTVHYSEVGEPELRGTLRDVSPSSCGDDAHSSSGWEPGLAVSLGPGDPKHGGSGRHQPRGLPRRDASQQRDDCKPYGVMDDGDGDRDCSSCAQVGHRLKQARRCVWLATDGGHNRRSNRFLACIDGGYDSSPSPWRTKHDDAPVALYDGVGRGGRDS